MRRIWVSVLAGTLALFVARALGVPLWNDGWSLGVIGDQCDFFVVAALLAWHVSRPSNPHE